MTKQQRAKRTRKHVIREDGRVRLSVFKSSKYIYAQLIDQTGKSLTGVKGKKAEETGKKIGEKAIKLNIKEVVFDRGAYQYHGQVKLLADAARAAGLVF